MIDMITIFLVIIAGIITGSILAVYTWDVHKVAYIRKKYGIIWNPMKIGVIISERRSDFFSVFGNIIGVFVIQFIIREKTEEEIKKLKKKYGVDD